MSEPKDTGSSAGIRKLVESWTSLREVPLKGQGIITGTGHLASGNSTVSGQGIVVDGVPSEEQQGAQAAIPDDELLIQTLLVGFTGPEAHHHIVRSVATPWIEIIKAIEHDPLFLHRIHPKKLEELVADAYRQEGYTDVILTPYSGDKGRDVIVSATLPGIGTIKIVDQVKRYAARRKVTADNVRALAGVLLRDQDVSKGIVTTTADFAPGIHEELKALLPTRIELKNGAALNQWLKGIHKDKT